MTQPTLSETLTELGDLCQFFVTAEDALKAGNVIDMTGIDARVSAVCQTVQKAIPEQQQQYLPELTTLIGLLQSYEKALRQWKDQTEEQQSAHAQS